MKVLYRKEREGGKYCIGERERGGGEVVYRKEREIERKGGERGKKELYRREREIVLYGRDIMLMNYFTTFNLYRSKDHLSELSVNWPFMIIAVFYKHLNFL